MSFVALVGPGGYSGWKFLQQTAVRQQQVLAQAAETRSAETHFSAQAKKVDTLEKLLSDFRSLNVVLSAFGLEGDIRNKHFLKKVLMSDLSDPKSLVNRLSDKRYLRMAETLQPKSDGRLSIGADKAQLIFSKYIQKTFESRVGDQDNNLRLAMNAKAELAELSERNVSEKTFWYTVIGSKPLRAVFQKALGLPDAISRLDVDRQYDDFTKRASKLLGSSNPAQFKDENASEKLIQRFLLMSQITSVTTQSPYSAALTILSR